MMFSSGTGFRPPANEGLDSLTGFIHIGDTASQFECTVEAIQNIETIPFPMVEYLFETQTVISTEEALAEAYTANADPSIKHMWAPENKASGPMIEAASSGPSFAALTPSVRANSSPVRALLKPMRRVGKAMVKPVLKEIKQIPVIGGLASNILSGLFASLEAMYPGYRQAAQEMRRQFLERLGEANAEVAQRHLRSPPPAPSNGTPPSSADKACSTGNTLTPGWFQ